MRHRLVMARFFAPLLRAITVCVALFAGSASAVTIDWVTVGDPGNACDVQPQGCFGAVAYTYRISKYEITNAQYAEFLNAVAATDPNELYSSGMTSGGPGLVSGGISRSGSSGSFTYSAIAGHESKPVSFVSFYDALRFANWLHNGQHSGAQDSTTTEDGAYTFSGLFTAGARNPDATIFLTSEDEWYKAAYYDPVAGIYFDYPAGADSPTTCAPPTATANTANCLSAVGDVTDVGSYTGSSSPNGTFDQGGNLYEWNEGVEVEDFRKLRGGSIVNSSDTLAASFSTSTDGQSNDPLLGFRVASLVPVPEPGTGLLVMAGLLGLAAWRMRRA